MEQTIPWERLPVFIGHRARSGWPAIPASVDACLYVNERLGLPGIKLTPELRQILATVYSHGSILSTSIGSSTIALNHLQEFHQVFQQTLGPHSANLELLEIGCGDGSLAKSFIDRGHRVSAIEIGPQAEQASGKGVRVLQLQVLQGSDVKEAYDCIYSNGVLEHVEDLEDMITSNMALLKPNGIYFHCVPNTQRAFECSDFQVIHLEHVWYFSEFSGKSMLERFGLIRCGSHVNPAGQNLYIWGHKAETPTDLETNLPSVRLEQSKRALQEYSLAAQKKLDRCVMAVQQYVQSGKRICFYGGGWNVALRLNSLDGIVFSDGDETKWGKRYFPNFPDIARPETLRALGVQRVIVFPEHHFRKIRESLSRSGIQEADVIMYSDLLKS